MYLSLRVGVAVWGMSLSAASPPGAVAILESKCLQCHGAAKMGNLDLRTREGALQGGASGPSIVAGDAAKSLLLQRVQGTAVPRMPMAPVPALTAEEIATLRTWIDRGAPWEKPAEKTETWWSFRPPVRSAIPKVRDPRWAGNPIDSFIEEARAAKGLTAAPEADRATLIRRLYLDMVGLVPDPAEVDSFVKDPSPRAYEDLVEKVLASPHYGERWGRYWLDVVRYADSSGFEHDLDLSTAWRFRDYVIRSLNQDKPYNQFLIEHLAGDELDQPTPDSVTATAFYRIGPRVRFREKDNPFYRYDYLDDVVRTSFQGFMGLSVHCARCHDHKFDPISRMDYYRSLAMFFGFVNYDHPLVPADQAREWAQKTRATALAMEPLKKEIARIEAPYRKAQFEAGLSKLPEEVQAAIRTPVDRRTEGQRLLAAQFERGPSGDGDPNYAGADPALGLLTTAGQRWPNVEGAPRKMAVKPSALKLSPADEERRAALVAELQKLQDQMPPAPPAVEGVRDGDYRLAPDGPGDEPLPGKTYRPAYPDLGSVYLPEPGTRYEVPWVRFAANGLSVEEDNKAEVVAPGFLSALDRGGFPVAKPPRRADYVSSGRRRALAEWIADPGNPLTARVIVNRVWYWHFGRGIVATPGNFGKMGLPPTHPELLDWLAVQFVEDGWSLKKLHRRILHSATYRMASSYYRPENAEKDSDNLLLWRYPVRRLDAEILRDVMLSASGSLNRRAGGPAFFPPIPKSVRDSYLKGRWEMTQEGPETWRRSVYSYWKRGLKYPMFDVHDQPDMNVTSERRNITTVPTQALTLLNGEFVLVQARQLAARVQKAAGEDAAAQVRELYRIALSREPASAEMAGQVRFLREQRERFGAEQALVSLAHVMLNANEFVYLN